MQRAAAGRGADPGGKRDSPGRGVSAARLANPTFRREPPANERPGRAGCCSGNAAPSWPEMTLPLALRRRPPPRLASPVRCGPQSSSGAVRNGAAKAVGGGALGRERKVRKAEGGAKRRGARRKGGPGRTRAHTPPSPHCVSRALGARLVPEREIPQLCWQPETASASRLPRFLFPTRTNEGAPIPCHGTHMLGAFHARDPGFLPRRLLREGERGGAARAPLWLWPPHRDGCC
ncbi:uncharacterized protein LOC132711364 [Pantherophis guttatus]|uniref:Uncharacterized protein LOC132711364 n=1 Tax=Pantherophis guttatus TaxID=94885 RepID=A0ABM3ZCM0_PANGU|nr:uncharacterized protein LOC132711364 [Pantherophis guttatus]